MLYGNFIVSVGLVIGALYLHGDHSLVYTDQVMAIFIAFYMILTAFSMIYDSIICIMDDNDQANSQQNIDGSPDQEFRRDGLYL